MMMPHACRSYGPSDTVCSLCPSSALYEGRWKKNHTHQLCFHFRMAEHKTTTHIFSKRLLASLKAFCTSSTWMQF